MKRLFTCFLFSILIIPAYSQEMIGIANSNYAGTLGLSLNPSSMVDSRLKFDLNLVTVGISFDNDYIYIPKSQMKFFGLENPDDINKKDTGYTDAKNFNSSDVNSMLNESYQGYGNALVRLPSVMFAIKKSHFGIRYTVRQMASADNVPAPIAKWFYSDSTFKYGPLLNKSFSFDEMKFGGATWGELAFSYGRAILNKGPHYLNGALTVKRLYGYYSGYIISGATNVMSYTTCDTCYSVSADQSIIDYGTSYQEADSANTSPTVKGRGWGFDIGFTYEYRPDKEQHYYKMDGEDLIDPEHNQYKWKVGVSVLDIGHIKFENSSAYYLNGSPNVEDFDTINSGSLEELSKVLSANYYNGDSTKSFVGTTFDMPLPHAISGQLDYHIHKKWYANMTWIQTLNASSKGPITNDILSITPRYEAPNFEVAVPFSMYQYTQARFGIAFRFWNVLVVGSDKIGAMMGFTDLGGMDAYAALKISIRKRRIKDKDQDQVSDKMDKCILEKGTWEARGCPDRDGDGINDALDSCPDVKGLAELHGCPDRDSDGIIDKLDSCPDVKGLAELHGCPDTDGDGITDLLDSCPDVKGLALFFGCPDMDGDSIIDKLDSCPDVKGLLQFHGCPDSDSDLVIDKLDSCPLVAGPVTNNGCPVAELKPAELTKAEQEVINKVFKNLEFESGKSVIKSSSHAALDELAGLLLKKPHFSLLIDGHTDNVGSAASNLKLSQNRANAVKKYLVAKGIDASRITATGYGLTKPIADNKTASGKQKNRRVEFTILE